MFVAWVDAHLKTDFEGPDCQEGSGRLSRFKTASSPLGQPPPYELLDPVAPPGYEPRRSI